MNLKKYIYILVTESSGKEKMILNNLCCLFFFKEQCRKKLKQKLQKQMFECDNFNAK